jgi:hypothetical protein
MLSGIELSMCLLGIIALIAGSHRSLELISSVVA